METVRQSKKRLDARIKVTGRARYGADSTVEPVLHGAVLRASIAHGVVKSIDSSRALQCPGVKAVLTGKDVPGETTFGLVIPNLPVLVGEGQKVRYKGDAVAIVAAETKKQAREALQYIEVVYEELPGVFDPEEALQEGAPQIHGDAPGNIVNHHPLRRGDVEKGFQEAHVILEREYSTQCIEHSYIEPEACVAIPHEGPAAITVHGCIQNPFATRKDLARVLNLPMNKVRVVQTYMGGSFGGKDQAMSQISARAALLALHTGQAVKMVYDREETFLETYKRHPFRMKYKVGARRDGTLTAMEIHILADSGAYCCMTPFVTWRTTVQCTGPYVVPNVKADIYGVYTNNVYTGAMRGFGSPQPIFAQESLMDELAEELGMDPLALRRKNGFRQNSVTATGQTLDSHTVSLMEVIDKATEKAGYEEKRARYAHQEGPIRRGIGLACSFRGCSLGAEGVDATGATVSVQEDGTVYVAAGLAENGMGLNTVFSQIAAEELGISLDRVVFLEADTTLIPDGGPTVASRSTLMGGNAVRLAAEKVRETLFGSAAKVLKAGAEELEARNDGIQVLGDSSRRCSFEEAVAAARGEGELLAAYGWYKAPKVDWDEEKGQGRAYFTYVYGCQVAEVEIDMETGQVKVLEVVAAHDVGRAINPEALNGQIYGGVAMAMGYALLEEVDVFQGDMKTLNFDEYLIPGARDMPKITPIIVENPDGFGPYGAKSIGEPTTELLAAAVANAVAQGANRRIRELPLDLERVLLGHSLKTKRYRRRD